MLVSQVSLMKARMFSVLMGIDSHALAWLPSPLRWLSGGSVPRKRLRPVLALG
jgi:hypothetical protein